MRVDALVIIVLGSAGFLILMLKLYNFWNALLIFVLSGFIGWYFGSG